MLDYKFYEGSKGSDTVVLLHGIGGSSNIFYKQLKAYKKHFHVVAVHLPGHGRSPGVHDYKEVFTFELAAGEIIKLLDHLKIKKAHFVGVSLGAVLTHSILRKAPERVKSAVLGGAITRVTLFDKLLLVTGHAVKNIVPHMWIYKIFARFMMPRKNHTESRKTFIKEAMKMDRQDFLGWFKIAHTAQPIYSKVPEASAGIPKLYLSGEQDHMFVKNVKADVKADECARMVIIKNCGHICNIEKPNEFNELSVDFMCEEADRQKKHLA